MISRLGYAILALLARQPSTGYELSVRAQRPLGYFWSAQHSQIYPELRKLLEAGLVSFDALHGPGPRDKKVYFLTDTGRGELAEWVVQPPGDAPTGRDDVLLKAYAVWTADPAEAARVFAGQIAGHEALLERYLADWAAVEGRHQGPPLPSHPDFGSYATLRCGIDYERQRIAWLHWLAGRLAAGASPRPPAEAPPDEDE